jgi:hypothetical protein
MGMLEVRRRKGARRRSIKPRGTADIKSEKERERQSISLSLSLSLSLRDRARSR